MNNQIEIIEYTTNRIIVKYGFFKKKNKYWTFHLCRDRNVLIWICKITRKKITYKVSIRKQKPDVDDLLSSINSLINKSNLDIDNNISLNNNLFQYNDFQYNNTNNNDTNNNDFNLPIDN